MKTLFSKVKSLPATPERRRAEHLKQVREEILDRGLVRFFVQRYADSHRVTYEGAHGVLSRNSIPEPEVPPLEPRRSIIVKGRYVGRTTAKDAQKAYDKFTEVYCESE